ncbi:MAG: NADH-quinone oxidoreductase subunit A [Chloroflexi bacterium]|nr:NADH-quinone oxidoreductase subunit A [Chloroflexota bacterium]
MNYTAVALAAVVGVVVIALLFLANYLLAPKRASPMKTLPYECGILPAPFTWSQIHIRYYLYAILFLVFDVEAVFLFPWVVIFVKSAPAVFYEMLIFLGILLFGILYGWKKGVLQWR